MSSGASSLRKFDGTLIIDDGTKTAYLEQAPNRPTLMKAKTSTSPIFDPLTAYNWFTKLPNAYDGRTITVYGNAVYDPVSGLPVLNVQI